MARPVVTVGYLRHKIAISMSMGLCAAWAYREKADGRSAAPILKNIVRRTNLNAQTRAGVRWFSQ